MGVSIYVMGDSYCEGVDFAYSGLQRLRQMAILATISYLTEKLAQLQESKESKNKKAKIECENNKDNNENNSNENSESEEEEETSEYQLQKIVDNLKTWTTTKKAEPLSFDSTKNSIFDLMGQFQQMMPIKYDNIRMNYNEEYFARHNLCGLFKFVNHSDCDGVHSYGDCVDIHELFTNIIPYLNETEENTEWFKSVDYVFEVAVESKHGIRYS